MAVQYSILALSKHKNTRRGRVRRNHSFEIVVGVKLTIKIQY